MRTAWLCLAPTLLVGFGVFGACGGTSDGGNPSAAGADNGGSSGNVATAGASHGGTGGMNGGASAGESSQRECDKTDCGPQLGLANWTCADGSVGGPTGRCLERPGGTCGWEINNCPMAGEGGATNQAGQGNAAGESGANGAAAAGESGAGGAAAEDCGVCSSGTICVFQIGGPGPSHFVCATRNPCGAGAACACIVGQGTCQPNLMGDPPRYCSCDNGLE